MARVRGAIAGMAVIGATVQARPRPGDDHREQHPGDA